LVGWLGFNALSTQIGLHHAINGMIQQKIYIYSRSSTNSKNMAKIGLVDFQIIGLTGIVKK